MNFALEHGHVAPQEGTHSPLPQQVEGSAVAGDILTATQAHLVVVVGLVVNIVVVVVVAVVVVVVYGV